VYEKRVQKRIFGSKSKEVAGCWRRLHNTTFSPIIRMIKSRRMRWEEHVARMGKMRNAYEIIFGNQ
jgi:hypothetical protein